MLKPIDAALNRITMYRLMLYYLIFLLGAAVILSFTGALAYDPFALLFSISFLLAAGAITNWAFSKAFGVPTNVESTYITSLILALIITPLQSYSDLWFLGWAAVLAVSSKYVLSIKGKHPFNPVAFAVAVTYFVTNQSASWWVGSGQMLPFVLVGGLLVVRKLRRFDLVASFLVAALITVEGAALFNGQDLFLAFQRLLSFSPYLFFAFVIITEPVTSPPTHRLRMIYGAMVGVLFTPVLHLGSFYTTPELALLIGNVYSYIVSPKAHLMLRLKEKSRITNDIFEYVFAPSQKIAYAPGQYMEWTLGHDDPDSRGNRRFFTLASSPTERDLRLGVKFYKDSSSYKRAMGAMDGNVQIVASQIAGDFTLLADPKQKCVFIAGGIGVTPFRSMIKYLLDTHQRRSIIQFYSNKTFGDIAYKDVFDKAEKELGIRTIYTVSDRRGLPPNWVGLLGRLQPAWILRYVPDYQERIFYLSGPNEMVDSFKSALHQLGIPPSQIKVDYFSGF
jgi:ferredoxin-NADP reductase/Na+-translocating ferredoxin:NAD+ oxidoreductase RnfD subunit